MPNLLAIPLVVFGPILEYFLKASKSLVFTQKKPVMLST